jgi:hypothetical protein
VIRTICNFIKRSFSMATSTTTTNPLVSELFQFFEDIPFGLVGTAIAAGGLNVPADVAAGEAFVAAVLKDFFAGASPTKAAASAAAAVGVPSAAAAVKES